MFPIILSTIAVISMLTSNPVISSVPFVQPAQAQILSQKDYSLLDRYGNSYVNNVFSDNILLTLAYMRGAVKNGQPVDWKNVKGDFTYTLIIKPGQTFAFHDNVLPQYNNVPLETTNAHFDSQQGFESDGWLVGDGVCHLASFMNVVARGAGLEVVSPTPHDFAAIPDVPKQYGVAIYYMPQESGSSALQNLYITNTFSTPVSFVFTHTGNMLHVSVEKSN